MTEYDLDKYETIRTLTYLLKTLFSRSLLQFLRNININNSSICYEVV